MKKERKAKGFPGFLCKVKIMNLSFKKIKLNENQEYEAVVHDVVVNKKKGMLWVFVELDEIRNQTFMKSFPLALTEGSLLWNSLNDNELLDRKGNMETDDLIGRDCVVTMSQGKDSNWYVDQLDFYIETEADDDWGDDFDDENDEEFLY